MNHIFYTFLMCFRTKTVDVARDGGEGRMWRKKYEHIDLLTIP